jgi:hypothetical protein
MILSLDRQVELFAGDQAQIRNLSGVTIRRAP